MKKLLFVFFIIVSFSCFGFNGNTNLDLNNLVEVPGSKINIKKNGIFFKFNKRKIPLRLVLFSKNKYFAGCKFMFWKCCHCGHYMNFENELECVNKETDCCHKKCARCEILDLEDVLTEREIIKIK